MWKAFLAALFVAASSPACADQELQSFLRDTLPAARERHHVPAIAALVMRDGRVEAEAAVGVRALGHPDPVTLHDRWHIGSDTKAFTATMIAHGHRPKLFGLLGLSSLDPGAFLADNPSVMGPAG